MSKTHKAIPSYPFKLADWSMCSTLDFDLSEKGSITQDIKNIGRRYHDLDKIMSDNGIFKLTNVFPDINTIKIRFQFIK
jgi:hypothetical protein